MSSVAMPGAIAPASAEVPVNKWLVTISVTGGTLMGTIDSSIVNVAIPHIQGAVGATIEQITWIATGFVIANVLIMPLTAFLGRFFGQKRFYMFCLVLFLVGSALCGMARSLETLVAFRVLQGFGAGALQPTESAILRQTFPPEEQGMAVAVFGMAVMIGPAVGPTLGGWIVDQYSWPWIFYVNIPVGLVSLLMVSRFVPEPEDIRKANHEMAEQQRKNMDWSGIALLCVGLAALQYMLEEGQSDDWFSSPVIASCALIAFFLLAAFTIRELTAPVPAVNLRLFKDPVFLSGTMVSLLMFAMLMANMFLLPVFMQELLGFTALQSGLALMPRVLVMMVATPFIGRIYNSVSPRLIIGIGVIAFSIGAYMMSLFTLETTSTGIITAIVVQGVGFSCLFVPLTTVAFSQVPRHKLTDATGLNGLLRQIGGSTGLAIFATMLSRYGTEARASLVTHLTPVRPIVADRLAMTQAAFQAKGYDWATAGTAAKEALGATVAQQSSLLAFEKVFLLAGILFLFVLPVLIFLKVDRSHGSQKVELEPMEM
jgi:MFS transporter, DHA2 family, multidrug resistance protein